MMWRVCEWLALFDPRRWVYSWRRARHVLAVTEAEASQDFYGSMDYESERALYWPAPTRLEYHHEEPDWREQTAADLAPEALDGGPTVSGPEGATGVNALSVQLDSGLGAGSSLTAPGPAPARAWWLDSGDLGPNAARVLARYEARFQERWGCHLAAVAA